MGNATDKWSSYVKPAQHQSASVPADGQLNSANAGVLILREGQLNNEYRHQGREFALEVADAINTRHPGVCTVYLYEETFGTQDKIHWLIHLNSLEDYVDLIQMGTEDEGFRSIFTGSRGSDETGGGGWSRMFQNGTFKEVVLTAHHWGSHGTRSDKRGKPEANAAKGDRPGRAVVRPAHHQVAESSAGTGTTGTTGGTGTAAAAAPASPGGLLHSGNAGAIIHRSGQLRHEFRSEGRDFARELADALNRAQGGRATTYVFEEHFGPQDRIHWLTHLRSLGEYHDVSAQGTYDENFRGVVHKERVKGGGDWSRMFVDGTLNDVLLVPQHPLKGF